ncbi:transglycosylase domain-containing protein [Pseudoneobacillus rhizosphaerae]|uniref:Penicillin-binding protein 1F n=1 Tax=Pseudoneobacillus rhizosphaerae TaxID=2880968 RepID=A0A9C7GCK2_9BACI|nr:PBP1A family penicillin-binding protein [Pseudoneobacillus rhizosphaerae]CAG9609515.1 Penicillin-binding protein 1F [Pseudoneobacillus rhizosphaerae]
MIIKLDLFKKKWKQLHLNQVFILSISTIVLGSICIFYYLANGVEVSALEKGFSQVTVIYDKDGNVASKISANKTESVTYEQIPQHMINAVVAIEDHRFFKHNGVDFIGIVRAFVRNTKAGGIVEGGSTITQQLTKNVFLSSEKSYKRKMDEVFLAREIEKEFTKEEILEIYLNTIYFGDGEWGIKRAALHYFGKEVEDLTIDESALLAGLIKAPSALSPYHHLEKATARRDVVLDRMREHNYLSEEQLLVAKNAKVVLNEKGGDSLRGKFPYYVDHVLEEAIIKYGLTQDELLTGGYKIYTELDPIKQEAMELVYKDESLFPNGTGNQIVQSGAILLNPKTGGIQALIGGRGEHVFRGFNRATQLIAQPGSTLKPLAVYTPALENGWKITDELKDEEMVFDRYEPKNYNDQYRGSLPMYTAVRESVNVPAVWLLNEIGLHKGLETLDKFGIPLEKKDRHLGVALGGMDKGVSPLIMAEAYSVFPNGGERIEGHSIVKIVSPNESVVAEWKGSEVKVTEKDVADKITTLLLDVVENGTGRAAKIPGREVAGKTGSTQVPIEGINGVKDQWFVGYTPELVGAIWIGYDKTDSKHYLTTTSSEGAALIFQKVMTKALENEEAQSFQLTPLAEIIETEEERDKWKSWIDLEEAVKKDAEKWREKIEIERDKWLEKARNRGKGKNDD